MLMKLDDWESPGLSPTEYNALIKFCPTCNKYMTANALDGHDCTPEILDLTADI